MNTPSENIPKILWSLPQELAEQDCACPDDGFRPSMGRSPSSEPSETDCACPDDGFAPAAPRLDTATAWQTAPALYRAPLPNDHELAFNPFGAVGVTVLNAPARRVLDAFAQPRALPQAIVALDSITPANVIRASHDFAVLGLLRPQGAVPVFTRTQPRTLTAWLHVTNACNLRCAYCYVNKTNEAMDEATGIAAVEATFQSALTHGFRAVKLKYAGGEATLNFRLVMKLHARTRELADAAGLELREVILSNGVALSNTMLDFLRNAGIRLMISLDGVGAAHNTQRAFANGRESYAMVARAVDRALARGVTPHLSITVTARSVDSLPGAVRFALDRDLPFNLNFFRDSDCTATHANLAADNARLIAGVLAAFAVIEENLPRRNLIGALVDRAHFDQPHEYTCGAGHNYLVIDQKGHVARCQMEIEQTVGDVWRDDPLLAVRGVQDDFQNVPVDEKESCRECSWRYWCAGGCPLLTYRATGRNGVKSPYCRVYKSLYPEGLRLEGLRLLKWYRPVD